MPVAGRQPPPVSGHAAVVVGNKMVVWGGESDAGFLEDMFIFDPHTSSWSIVVIPKACKKFFFFSHFSSNLSLHLQEFIIP